MTEVAIDPSLFAWPATRPALLGSTCRACATTVFPQAASCPKCTSEDVEQAELPTRGRLWSWTVQGFRPKSPPYAGPEEFEPYGVGYVELPGAVIVESRLTTTDPASLRIGMNMDLVIIPFATRDDGTTLMTFAFGEVS